MDGRELEVEARLDMARVRGSTNTDAVSVASGTGCELSSSSSLSSRESRSSIMVGMDWMRSKKSAGEAGAGAEWITGEWYVVGICKVSDDP